MMHFEIESAGVADGVAMLVASPQRRHVSLAVSTRRAGPLCRRLQ